MRTSPFRRTVASALLLVFLLDLLAPTAAYALTGGPSQPEFESFEPVSTDQMVDLFTGDFNYNIPLMTVPGPNGGYPINLAYHAGIGMEQEASWVGLGWNINAGVVNRVLRGLPDDFNGDLVEKETRMRPNNTVSIKGSNFDMEAWGFQSGVSSGKAGLYFNNYRGVGMTVGATVGPSKQQLKKKMDNGGIVGRVSLEFDSQKGLEMVPSLSHEKDSDDRERRTSLSMSVSSTYGLQSMEFSSVRNRKALPALSDNDESEEQNATLGTNSRGTGFSFSSPSFVPSTAMRTTGRSINLGIVYGTVNPSGVFKPMFNLSGGLSSVYIPQADLIRNIPAYGYLHADQQPGLAAGLMDFNREKDYPVTRRAPYVPMPIFTYDPFLIKGQGTGGIFRPFRSDIGILTDERAISESHGAEVQVEFGPLVPPLPLPAPPSFKIGADAGYSYAESFGGSWQNGAGAITDPIGSTPLFPQLPLNTIDLTFQPASTQRPLYEPFYFKVAGERTASPLDEWSHIKGTSPARFDLRAAFEMEGGLPAMNMEPRLRNRLSNNPPSGIPREKNIRAEREKRVQNVEHRTRAQIVAHPEYGARPTMLYPPNTSPQAVAGSQYDFAAMPQHHVGEVTVQGPDGTRHIYGLPVYVTEQAETVFSMHTAGRMNAQGTATASGDIGEYDNSSLAQTPTAAIAAWVDNGDSHDKYFSSTKLPAYTHSYLLTAVVSHDYVDLTGNGPSPDDLGYYTKFNYTETETEDWRSPYRGVHYMTGHHSNTKDDKGSFTRGSKHIHYLHSIETKTHYAVFITSARTDARGAAAEPSMNGVGAFTARKLDRIDLHSRADNTNQALKSVIFTYTDALCKGAPNNAANGGKLTLKSVHFLHMGSLKGSLSKYEFRYGTVVAPNGDVADADENPNYSSYLADRWGSYRGSVTNDVWKSHPYVNQTDAIDDVRNKYASAWCLREVRLPSGGRINIEYESDDYAFVQDKPAMQMFKITGTSETNATAPDGDQLLKKNLRIYVDLGRDYDNPLSAMQQAMHGIHDVYFKTWQRLKRKPVSNGAVDPDAFDYVDGYAKIDPTGTGITSNPRIGYFTLEQAMYGIGNNYKVHPFRKAGWQYLRFERPDLLFPPNDALNNNVLGPAPIIASLNGILSGARLIIGYYNMAGAQGWCKRMAMDPEKPSFVRLNTPSGSSYTDPGGSKPLAGKFGGGHRVKSISVSDEWTEGSATYGKTYEYTTTAPDGRTVSSGVAEYEPLLGGEEIALRKPIWYNNSDARISFRNAEAFLEEPLGEALYPGASVGYSRVTVRDVMPANTEASGNGTTVQEFYTAKDFPVRVEHTDLDYVHFAPPPIPIPLIGSIAFNNHGYSQGYAVHLNDMHGKLKAVETYPQCADLSGQPKTRTFYKYNTEQGQPNRLSSMATVLTDHFAPQQMALGTTTEFYADLREHSSKAIEGKININFQNAGFAFFPLGIPGFQYSKSLFRSVATTKVVHRLGILGEVVNEVDGARATTHTVAYDAFTGEPLLTVVNNEHEKPVYTYKYAAHMAYEGMSGAYKNWGAGADLTSVGNGVYTVVGDESATAVFQIGDEVTNAAGNARAWVADIQGQNITLLNSTNNPVASGFNYARVTRSGRRNMQSVQNGSIVSLQNPMTLPMPDVLYQFNAQMPSQPINSEGYCAGNVNDQCSFIRYGKCGTTEVGPHVLGVKMSAYGPPFPLPMMWAGVAIVFDHNEGVPGSPGCKPALFLAPPASAQPQSGYDLIGEVFNMNDIVITGMNSQVMNIPLFGEAQGVNVLINGGTTPVAGFWWDPDRCFPRCENVIHADITEFADAWTYDYADVGNPTSANGVLSTSTVNPYRYGQAGVWRPVRNHLYQVDRKNTEGPITHINTDGEYQRFIRFDFDDPAYNPENRWVRREEMTRYSPYGFALESIDANNIPSCMLYGYSNSLAVAKAANAGYYEVAYDGFEDHGTNYTAGRGHLAATTSGGGINVSTAYAHSGNKSLAIVAGQHLKVNTTVGNNVLENWVPLPQQRYTVSAWVRANNSTYAPYIEVLGNGAPMATTVDETTAGNIEGWKKITATFTAPASGTPLEVRIGATGASAGQIFLDDIRIHPADASMVSYAYDPHRLWLRAELDDRNYATFYNYDEEGTLVQVKKETERGVMTLRTTRKNVVQLP